MLTATTALLLTLAIEVPLLVGLCRLWLPALPWRAVLCAGLLVSCFTHPLLWWGRPASWLGIAGAEVLVVLVEGVLLALLLRGPWWLLMGISLLVNGASLLLGVALWLTGRVE